MHIRHEIISAVQGNIPVIRRCFPAIHIMHHFYRNITETITFHVLVIICTVAHQQDIFRRRFHPVLSGICKEVANCVRTEYAVIKIVVNILNTDHFNPHSLSAPVIRQRLYRRMERAGRNNDIIRAIHRASQFRSRILNYSFRHLNAFCSNNNQPGISGTISRKGN